VAADVWSVTSWNELRRDAIACEQHEVGLAQDVGAPARDDRPVAPAEEDRGTPRDLAAVR